MYTLIILLAATTTVSQDSEFEARMTNLQIESVLVKAQIDAIEQLELESIKLEDGSAAVGVQDQERQDAIRIQFGAKKKEEIDALKQRLHGITSRHIVLLEVQLQRLRAAESPDAKAIAKRQSELESLKAVSHDELRDIKTRSSFELELEVARAELRRAQEIRDRLTDRLRETKATLEDQRRIENILEKERDLRQKKVEQLREQVRQIAEKAAPFGR